MVTAMSLPSRRSPARLLAVALASCSALLGLAAPALALTSKPTAPAGAATLPVPASARVGGAPARGAAAPTTTYVPSSGTSLPRTPTGATTSPPSKPLQSTTARAPARAGTHRSGGLSAAAIAIAAIAALVALGAAAWGLARRRAFEPHWTLSARHAMAEAGTRASSTWAEFSDWIRVGH
jgi:hypothetical protein